MTDLTESGYLTKHRNRYELQSHRQVNDDAIELTIGDVLDLLTRTSDAIGNVDDE